MKPSDSPAQQLIKRFALLPHPEGGYYRETYRSSISVAVGSGRRDASTAIYYLLERGDYSAWHRIHSDELWHFYTGSALNVHVIDEQGRLITHRLGDPLQDSECVSQALVPAGRWFAAELAPRVPQQDVARGLGDFSLVGCTVAPGFEFNEFELAETEFLLRMHPGHADLIRRLAPTKR